MPNIIGEGFVVAGVILWLAAFAHWYCCRGSIRPTTKLQKLSVQLIWGLAAGLSGVDIIWSATRWKDFYHIPDKNDRMAPWIAAGTVLAAFGIAAVTKKILDIRRCRSN